MAMIGRIAMEGKGVIIPHKLQQLAIKQLHINHMGIGKMTRHLAREPVYWVSMNNDIENAFKIVPLALNFSR